ncbi:CotY/CotZ family spore coat protein [Lysinibacillus yapensis]|nr:CotY/CotZ family spore coat protein [Lysinibacillus yapensis]
MEKCVQLSKNHSLDVFNSFNSFNRHLPLPFMFLTNCGGEPFMAIGENKKGYHFFSPYFLLKKMLDESCMQLMILEPVGTDGCLIEYPERFYSLQTTGSSILVLKESISAIQTFSSDDIDRKLIDPGSKKD